MKLRERIEKIKLFFKIDEELQMQSSQLETVKKEIVENNNILEDIEKEIVKKKKELQSLRTEIVELKDFINSNFEVQFKDYDYKVNITNCYIIGINGKKYISLRKHNISKSDWYTVATWYYNVETYRYYDALNQDENGKYKFLYEAKWGYFDNKNYRETRVVNKAPDYEQHILEVYPELSAFVDNLVPNTYLKKIYYEANDLGAKSLVLKDKKV